MIDLVGHDDDHILLAVGFRYSMYVRRTCIQCMYLLYSIGTATHWGIYLRIGSRGREKNLHLHSDYVLSHRGAATWSAMEHRMLCLFGALHSMTDYGHDGYVHLMVMDTCVRCIVVMVE